MFLRGWSITPTVRQLYFVEGQSLGDNIVLIHITRVYSNGTVKGEINCLAHGWTSADAMYLKGYLKACGKGLRAGILLLFEESAK